MINNYHNIYFIGIGGIGMSALALYFHKSGVNVAGYDLVKNQNCKKLESVGINIHYEENIEKIPKTFLNKQNTLIVYTPAIPETHEEYQYFTENNFKIIKRAKALGLISESKKSLCIAGTHGKTSVSTLVSWIMHQSALKCSAFLGGISKNINSNLILNENSELVVLEADEFDRSFLNFKPFISLVTCIEADHLDIYKNYENLEKSFIEYINSTNKTGKVVLHEAVNNTLAGKINSQAEILTYSYNNSNTDFYADNIQYINQDCTFDIITPDGKINNIYLQYGGSHNLENTVAATAVSILAGASHEEIIAGIKTYTGVKRRFDIQINTDNAVYIDDYAHHPGEINATLNSVKKLFPDKKITIVFQPHLFSRTNDFAIEFAESLSRTDSLILLPIYPAREKPIKGVTSELIFKNCSLNDKKLCNKEELLSTLDETKPELLITMGAGDIDNFVEPIKELLLNRDKNDYHE